MTTREDLLKLYNETRYKHISICIPYQMVDIETNEVLDENKEWIDYTLANICESYAEKPWDGIWFIYENDKTRDPFNVTEKLLGDWEEKGWLKILD